MMQAIVDKAYVFVLFSIMGGVIIFFIQYFLKKSRDDLQAEMKEKVITKIDAITKALSDLKDSVHKDISTLKDDFNALKLEINSDYVKYSRLEKHEQENKYDIERIWNKIEEMETKLDTVKARCDLIYEKERDGK